MVYVDVLVDWLCDLDVYLCVCEICIGIGYIFMLCLVMYLDVDDEGVVCMVVVFEVFFVV